MTDKRVFLNATPSWTAILPLLLRASDADDHNSRKIALTELFRMAQLADAYVALTKKDQTNG